MNRSTPSEFLSLRLDAVDLAVESIRADLAALQQPDGEQQQPFCASIQDQIELFIAQELQRHWQDAICPDHGGDWQSLTDAQRAAWRRLVPVARKLINTQTTQKQ